MEFLLDGISMLSWKQIVMYGVGILLIWLAIKRIMSLHCCCRWDLELFW